MKKDEFKLLEESVIQGGEILRRTEMLHCLCGNELGIVSDKGFRTGNIVVVSDSVLGKCANVECRVNFYWSRLSGLQFWEDDWKKMK